MALVDRKWTLPSENATCLSSRTRLSGPADAEVTTPSTDTQT